MANRASAITVALLLALCAPAADDAKKPIWKKPPPPKMPVGTPAEQVKSLTDEFQSNWDAFAKRGMACTSSVEEMLVMLQMPPRQEYADLLLKIAQDNPKDPAAGDALIWVIRIGQRPSGAKDKDCTAAKAFGILKRDHLDHPNIGLLCHELRVWHSDTGARDVCRHILAHHSSADARTRAAFSLSDQLRYDVMMTRSLKRRPDQSKQDLVKAFGVDWVAHYEGLQADELEKEAESLLELIVKTPEYASVKVPRRDPPQTYGELATQTLFRERHLVPGKPAPDVSGEDLDGQPVKLSDYRGKVVVINFWGTWCHPCMAQVPEEKKLVKHFEGRPFVLIGINCDEDREHAKSVANREQMNWRSIWDKDPGNGPLQRLFAVEGYPTGYIIDHKGAIISQFHAHPKVHELIEKHVKQAETPTGLP